MAVDKDDDRVPATVIPGRDEVANYDARLRF
jgi:hypothetical protein